jgi:poly(hydroxyalkanoate) depolymerase family esterase
MWQEYLYNGPAGSRLYSVYMPVGYRVGTAVPLLVMLHGCVQTAGNLAAGSQMNRLADKYNFIVVYPQQTRAYQRTLCWHWYSPAHQLRGSGEPAIIAGMVQEIERTNAQWTIDRRRVYVAGISAGGAMAVVLGATYPNLFAAIGVHSGAEYRAADSFGGILRVGQRGGPDPLQQGQVAYDAMGSRARVVPTIVVQGTRDPIVRPINGDQVVQQWMQTNVLASGRSYDASFNNPANATSSRVPGGHSYTVYTWKDKYGNEVQQYWKVMGLGHAWSGGNSDVSYTDSRGPDASLAMYTFFKKHPMSGSAR